MADTQALPDVQVELTGSELTVHLSCYLCYPITTPFEVYAFCGARLARIDATGRELDCEECADLLYEPCPECGMSYEDL